MHEHIEQLKAPHDRMLHLWFEPWAEGLGFPAGMAVELRALSPLPGKFELDATTERTAVYGWAGSTLQVFADGALVHSFDQAVPDVLSNLSTRENITLLFGAPPVPTAEEGGSPRKRPWWRMWDRR
jgi:hypothetical protein